jgi:hypothetical protein
MFKENGVRMAEDMGKGDANGVTRMVMASTDWRSCSTPFQRAWLGCCCIVLDGKC